MIKRLFLSSIVSLSSVVMLGNPLTPPFTETFDDPETCKDFTIINANNDDALFAFEEGVARLRFSMSGPSDDWLVLPALQLEKGRGYTISFDAFCQYARYPETFEVKAATEATARALKNGTQIISRKTVSNLIDNPYRAEAIFTPEEDGVYYIGIHGCSPQDMFFLNIDNLSVSEGILAVAPGPVTEASAERDPSGALKVTINYTAPSVDFSGEALAALDGVKIYRDDALIATQTPKPGEKMTFTDSKAVKGEALYTLIPFNADGEGEPVKLSVFAGFNVPEPVTGLKVVTGDHNGQARLTWDAVTTDITGLTYPEGAVTYNVLRVYGLEQLTVAKGLTETEYCDNFCDPEADQVGVYYTIVPVSEAGEGLPTNAPYLCLGASYTVPFAESFPEGEPSYAIWVTDGPGAWSMKGDYDSTLFASQDSDNGFALVYSYDTEVPSELITGRISLADLPDAVLTFHTLAYTQQGEENLNDTEVAIDCGDGEGFTSVKTFTGNPSPDGSKWIARSVDLTDWAGKEIRIAFRFFTSSHIVAGIDNILIKGRWEHNLAADELALPASIIAGIETEIPFTFSNIGTDKAEGYKVVLYRDGESAVTVDGPELASGESATLIFKQTPSSLWEKGVSYSAAIEYPSDGQPENNVTPETVIAVRTLDLPVPGEISGTGVASSATLSWGQPIITEMTPVEINDDLSSLTPFSNGMTGSALGGDDNIGDWSMIDGDGLPSIKVSGAPFINNGMPMAFIVFNQKEAGLQWEMFTDHGGDGNMFISFSAVNGRNDDWLISPRLTGEPQTISFFTKSIVPEMPERYQVFYSKTGKDKEDFIAVGSYRSAGDNWEKVTVSLPDGAIYFAICYSSLDHNAILLDDFTYTPEPLTTGLELIGYNLYRGKELLNTEPLPLPTLSGLNCGEDDEFCATALYNKGESAPTFPYIFGTSGIINPESAIEVTVSTGSISIIAPEGDLITVTDLTGCVRHRAPSVGHNTVSLPAGLYILSVGSSVRKIIVP